MGMARCPSSFHEFRGEPFTHSIRVVDLIHRQSYKEGDPKVRGHNGPIEITVPGAKCPTHISVVEAGNSHASLPFIIITFPL
jgi:hypothetical protein